MEGIIVRGEVIRCSRSGQIHTALRIDSHRITAIVVAPSGVSGEDKRLPVWIETQNISIVLPVVAVLKSIHNGKVNRRRSSANEGIAVYVKRDAIVVIVVGTAQVCGIEKGPSVGRNLTHQYIGIAIQRGKRNAGHVGICITVGSD